MRTSQQHLNQIRKWLRKQELDEIKAKVRTEMLEDYGKLEGEIELPMELEEYSNSRSSHHNQYFNLQRHFLIES